MRARDLLPALVVLALACLGAALDRDPCASVGTDGPQYRCWLQQQQP